MKLQITEKQWHELDASGKSEWKAAANIDDYKVENESGGPDIGMMIEFLGDDWDVSTSISQNLVVTPDNEDLCDALWNAVKEKLAQ